MRIDFIYEQMLLKIGNFLQYLLQYLLQILLKRIELTEEGTVEFLTLYTI